MVDVYKPGAERAVSLLLHSSRLLREKENIYVNLGSNLETTREKKKVKAVDTCPVGKK
jgi:hypothetical protein